MKYQKEDKVLDIIFAIWEKIVLWREGGRGYDKKKKIGPDAIRSYTDFPGIYFNNSEPACR